MCEDPHLTECLRLPWPGTSAEPTAEERAKAAAAHQPLRQPKRPTEADDCFALRQSVGWWEGVHMAGAGWQPGDRNIVLSLNVDGFQPFQRGGITITPMTCMVLNLPENLRHRAEHMLMAGIIPKGKPKDYSTYLRLLIDELKQLYASGFDFTDPITGEKHNVRVKLLFTCCDYPAHCDLNCQRSATSYDGCIKCDIKVSGSGCGTHCGRRFNTHVCGCLTAARCSHLLLWPIHVSVLSFCVRPLLGPEGKRPHDFQ
jgi:hypothetical protein